MKKLITIITPTFNEQDNVELAHDTIEHIFSTLPDYNYEHIFIDNASTDNTLHILKYIASNDPHVKIIVNTRNFGHIRSPYHALLQSTGDATITFVADLQDPVSLIPRFIHHWEKGFKVVIGVKNTSQESKIKYGLRTFYYKTIDKLSEIKQIKHFTGFGLYDKDVISTLRSLDDPYPYFRGLITEIGYDIYTIHYDQRKRKCGNTHNNLYTLYDIAMLGITNHSKIPLRLATIIGFTLATLSLITAFIYTLYKLIHWQNFDVGIAPIVIGLFFFSSIQLFFVGIIGEYIGSIHTQTLHRPLVIEKERINF